MTRLADEVERLTAERDFLLLRANAAGSCSFREDRWTGASSNALVTVAFGGNDDTLPHDSHDLAACYRTVMRLPRHLLSDSVLAQLGRGERRVGKTERAVSMSGWPGIIALRARAAGEVSGG